MKVSTYNIYNSVICNWGEPERAPHLREVQRERVCIIIHNQARTQGFEKGGYIVKKFPLHFWHFNVKLFFSHDSMQE